jgi:hypothetical protein
MKVIINKSKVELIIGLIKREGANYVATLVGGTQNLLKIFGGDLKMYYEYTGFVPYKIDSSGMSMYIDDLFIQSLDLYDTWTGREKILGDFRWTSSGINYKFTVYMSAPIISQYGQQFRKVTGSSGSHGFGVHWITKRNTIGKRGRKQIFKQIIEKYNLDSYL